MSNYESVSVHRLVTGHHICELFLSNLIAGTENRHHFVDGCSGTKFQRMNCVKQAMLNDVAIAMLRQQESMFNCSSLYIHQTSEREGQRVSIDVSITAAMTKSIGVSPATETILKNSAVK